MNTAITHLWNNTFATLQVGLPEAGGTDLYHYWVHEFAHTLYYASNEQIIEGCITLLEKAFKVSVQLGAKPEMIRVMRPTIERLLPPHEAVEKLSQAVEYMRLSSVGHAKYSQVVYPIAMIDAVYTLLWHIQIDVKVLEAAIMERLGVGIIK